MTLNTNGLVMKLKSQGNKNEYNFSQKLLFKDYLLHLYLSLFITHIN